MYAFFSTYLSRCVARDACIMFCSMFLTAFLFSFSFSTNSTDTDGVSIAVRKNSANMPKLFFHLHIHFSHSCIYVCLHMKSHLPPLNIYSYVWFAFCSISKTILFFPFFLFYASNRHLYHGAYRCTHNPAHHTYECRIHMYGLRSVLYP